MQKRFCISLRGHFFADRIKWNEWLWIYVAIDSGQVVRIHVPLLSRGIGALYVIRVMWVQRHLSWWMRKLSSCCSHIKHSGHLSVCRMLESSARPTILGLRKRVRRFLDKRIYSSGTRRIAMTLCCVCTRSGITPLLLTDSMVYTHRKLMSLLLRDAPPSLYVIVWSPHWHCRCHLYLLSDDYDV